MTLAPGQGLAYLLSGRCSLCNAGRVCECLEAERIKYAIRLLANRIGYLLKRPVGRLPNTVRRSYANFTYQAVIWTKPRRVIAKY